MGCRLRPHLGAVEETLLPSGVIHTNFDNILYGLPVMSAGGNASSLPSDNSTVLVLCREDSDGLSIQ
jgi:hypothetical protein